MNLFKQILSLQLVMALSIGLLLFIGVGESYRVAPSLFLTNVCNQAQLLKGSIETNLKLGVPIEFEGFNSQAVHLVQQSKQIAKAQILISNKKSNQLKDEQTISLTCDMSDKALLREIQIDWLGLVMKSSFDSHYQIMLNLKNNFNSVGKLIVTPYPGLFTKTINEQFQPIFIKAFFLIIILPIIISLMQYVSSVYLTLIQKGLYHLTFVVIGIVIINGQISLYTTGIKEQSYSMARSLEARLSEPSKLGFDINSDFSGINTLLHDYLLKNKDLSHIYLNHNNKVTHRAISAQYLTRQTSERVPECDDLQQDLATNEFITTCSNIEYSRYNIVVKTPWARVYSKLWNATRNICFLFIASILLSNMFLDVVLSLQKTPKSKRTKDFKNDISTAKDSNNINHMLKVIRPVFILAVLMEAVNLSFLPGYLTMQFSHSEFSASMAFTAYFICFAAVLIPSGRWAESHNLQYMMVFSLILAAVSLGGLTVTQTDIHIILLRAIAGAGQGILFIAIQSFLLKLESKQSNFKGSEQLVIGFNISTISGVTIGALLMPIMGEQGVFLTGGIIGLICILYCISMLRGNESTFATDKAISSPKHHSECTGWIKIKKIATDVELYKSILLVGLPSKALYVGVLIFIMPIFLIEKDFDTDAIGQIIIFYYIGVLLSTLMLSQVKYFKNNSKLILTIGNIGSGIGLIIIGSIHWLIEVYPNHDFLLIITVIIGILLVGLSHGFIHAPVVSYVVETKNAALVGKATMAAAYRFIERVGHIMGPYLAYLLLVDNGNTHIEMLKNIGLFLISFGIIFIISTKYSLNNKAK